MRSTNNTSLAKAEQFLKNCIRGGMAHSLVLDTSLTWVKPYPEVTGYLVSYFCTNGQSGEKVVEEALDRLLEVQHSSGGFSSFYDTNNLYSFDTGQIMYGLLSAYQVTRREKYLKSAKRAGDFLLSMQLPSGLIFPIYDTKNSTKIVYQRSRDGSNWGSIFSYIQVKNAEGLLLLSKLTEDKRYARSASKLANIKLTEHDYDYTHPFAYYLEGMLALGKKELVKQVLRKRVIPRLKPSGYIAYYPECDYAYTSGSVQMGILLWKAGYKNQAKLILDWARVVQGNSESGGLYQYALPSGLPDYSVHGEINSWGTKYYAELLRLVVN